MHATLNAFLDPNMTVTLEQAEEQFALRLTSKEGTLLVWLTLQQLNALGFAVEVAQQEAEHAAYNADMAADDLHQRAERARIARGENLAAKAMEEAAAARRLRARAAHDRWLEEK